MRTGVEASGKYMQKMRTSVRLRALSNTGNGKTTRKLQSFLDDVRPAIRRFAFDTRERAHFGIHDIPVNDGDVRGVARQVVVELRSDFPHSWQSAPRDLREVVVLVVVSDVEVEKVTPSIVRVSFLVEHELVVFSDKVASTRVKTETNQCAKDHVAETDGPERRVDKNVEGKASRRVHELPKRRRLRFDVHRSQGVEGGLQEHPEELEK